jgi:YgiT-type zinc finger domain-containing protein
MKRRTIKDPDVGEFEAPPSPPKSAFRTIDARLRAAARANPQFVPGRKYPCDSCGKTTFEGRTDVALEVVRRGVVYVFRNLHGAVCKSCGAKTVESYEMYNIDDQLHTGFRTSFRARVTNVGKGAVGTYWPKDVQRMLRLDDHRDLEIEVLSPELALVRVMANKVPDPAQQGERA